MGSLFVDKYRPKGLENLDYHDELSDRLRALVRPIPFVAPPRFSPFAAVLPIMTELYLSQASSDFPHTLFYGPSGAGKKTRIMACLRELFGPGVEKVRLPLKLGWILVR